MPDDPLATERAAMWACAQCAKHFLVLTADETAPGVCPCCQSRNLYQTYSYWVTPTMEEVETEDTPRVVTRSLTTPALAVRPVVQWFAAHMEAKLRANDHKGGWSTETSFALAARIFDEWRELGRALSLWSINATDVTTVVAECADVAAFAMMVADVVSCGSMGGSANAARPPVSTYLLVSRDTSGTNPCFWTGTQWSSLNSEAKRYTPEEAKTLTDAGLSEPSWPNTDVGWMPRKEPYHDQESARV